MDEEIVEVNYNLVKDFHNGDKSVVLINYKIKREVVMEMVDFTNVVVQGMQKVLLDKQVAISDVDQNSISEIR